LPRRITLERIAAPGNPTSERDEFSGVDPALILVASHLIAFAGIFFLWFIGVVRSRLGSREDQFFSSVLSARGSSSSLRSTRRWRSARRVSPRCTVGRRRRSSRCASPSTPATSSGTSSPQGGRRFHGGLHDNAERLGAVARWMTVFGYVGALMLLFTIPHVEWLLLVFPLWVLVVSIQILRDGTHEMQNAVSKLAAG
jgi:hypothetical protein